MWRTAPVGGVAEGRASAPTPHFRDAHPDPGEDNRTGAAVPYGRTERGRGWRERGGRRARRLRGTAGRGTAGRRAGGWWGPPGGATAGREPGGRGAAAITAP